MDVLFIMMPENQLVSGGQKKKTQPTDPAPRTVTKATELTANSLRKVSVSDYGITGGQGGG